MKIVVLCGGLSPERDVSITSGTMAARALRARGHRVALVDLFFGYDRAYDAPDEAFTTENHDDVSPVAEREPDLAAVRASRKQDNSSRIGDNVVEICRAADIVFIALHGEDGEDGKIQALFDLEGLKYTGTGALGSALAMNKFVAKQLFRQNGISTPDGIQLTRDETPYVDIGFPCVVKPCSSGSSVGVSIVGSEADYGAALELAFRSGGAVIVEKYIAGREYSVGVISGKALPVIEVCPKSGFYDYKNKYQSGLTNEICPADLPAAVTEKLQRAAERVYRALVFDVYGRMDFMVDGDGNIWCLEGNTLPGLTPTSLLPQEAAAVGTGYEDLCETIVRESLRKYDSFS